MTDLANAPATSAERSRWRTPSTLAAGLFGGFALGVIARAWMRLITEDPEFTWKGTIFIVGASPSSGSPNPLLRLHGAGNHADGS